MKIGIIGAGNVGATLGRRFAETGHEVSYGVRDVAKAKQLSGKTGSVTDVSRDSELIVIAVPYDAVTAAIEECGDLAGKIVVDATNPLEFINNGLALTIGFETSGGEKMQELIPAAKVVKCFNTTGFVNMAKPDGSMMFACGNDKDATDIVTELASSIGFEAMNIGDMTKARLLEPLAALWIHLAFTSDLKRDFAFHLRRTL